jgi:hypothetical protein
MASTAELHERLYRAALRLSSRLRDRGGDVAVMRLFDRWWVWRRRTGR